MATASGKKARRSEQLYNEMGYQAPSKANVKFPKLVPQSYRQQDYIEAIHNKDIIFATGDAGTGKTFVATHYAAEQLYYKRIDKIILTRPAEEAYGEELGFLPGDLNEKFTPYLTPYLETLNELLGKSFVEYCIKVGTIEAVPLAFMLGRSFKDCVILADEMQNSTPAQMRMLLTRMGENTKMLINGDMEQRESRELCGIEDAIGVLRHVPEVEVITFTDDDCVRSGLCKKILRAYKGYR